MQNPVLDFLGTALVPILGAYVAAGPPGYIHLALVPVAALGANPNQLVVILLNFNLPIEATDLAVLL